MDTSSYWIESGPLPRFPRPSRDLQVDVVVIGGGITGVTAAYLFKQAGLTVALLERERFARIDTGHTTAHLTSVIDARLHHLIQTFGAEAARAVWDGGAAATDQIFNVVRAESIHCDFAWLPGYLHAPLRGAPKDARAELERESAAAALLGIPAEYLPRIPGFGVPGVKFPHQAIFHPRKYLAALLRKIPGRGSHVFENSSADEILKLPFGVK
jgi:glycine/D-amino acid oxidase-like deaminating enzyme